MKISTLNNFHERMVFLEKIKIGEVEIDVNSYKYFDSIKDFCKLDGESFAVIAYNTLKSAAYLVDSTGKGGSSSWDEFKFLFHQAKDIIRISIDSSPPLLPRSEVLAEKALLDAHICSMAYMELLAFLSGLSETLDKNPAQFADKIRTQLEISKAKFKSIISYANNYDGTKPALTLIKK